MRVETIGNATLYLGDCLALKDQFQADAIVTDPPYGQNYKVRYGQDEVIQRNGTVMRVKPNEYPPIRGDDREFDPTPWLSLCPTVILWGAHKFAHRLPPGGWFVWDKMPNGKVKIQGDGEAAWINRAQPMRIYRLLWDGICAGSEARHEITAGQRRYHPAQKPEALMRWCITQAGDDVATVLDPYMGSGSTGVAAAHLSKNFIGVEIEPAYFDIACERIENAQRQERLFA